jgi:hypothetical protein
VPANIQAYQHVSREHRAAEPPSRLPSTGTTGHHGRAALGAGECCLRDAARRERRGPYWRGAAHIGEALRGSPRPLGLERLTSSS